MVVFLRFLFNLFIVFGYLFEFELVGPLTTRRLSFLLAALFLLYHKKEVKRLLISVKCGNMKTSVMLFSLCGFLLLINKSGTSSPYNEYFEIHYLLYILLYILVFAIYVVTAFKDAYDFFKVYISVFFIQACAVFLSATNDAIRIFLFMMTVGDERFERTIENGSRIVGIGLHSSTGSIICSTACVLIGYLKLNNSINNLFFMCSYLLITMITLFIGRTGVLVEVGVLFFVMLYSGQFKRLIPYILVLIVIVPFLVLNILDEIGVGEVLLEWMTEIFDSDKRGTVVENIFQEMPNFLSSEYFLGTGVIRGKTLSGDNIQVDSGFVNIYTSLGVIGFVSYYLAFIKMYSMPVWNTICSKIRNYFLFLILCSFCIEFKEPYMMKYAFPWMIVTLILFETKKTFIKNVS